MDYPGEKLVIKLWETVAEKAIGGLLRPWQIRREGRARADVRAYAKVAMAQAEKEAQAIRRGERALLNDGRIVAIQAPATEDGRTEYLGLLNVDSATGIAVASNIVDSIRREVNVAKALLEAEAALSEDPQEPPAASVSEDWLYRWRDGAETVSTEDLQTLWGRVLAGEVKAPGSFSLRTLDFLRNLSQTEARAIEKLGAFLIGDGIYKEDAYLAQRGVTFAVLLEMQELGILSGVDATGLLLEFTLLPQPQGGFAAALLSHDKILFARSPDANKKVVLRVYRLSAVGRELLRLGNFDSNDDYLRMVGKAIKGQGFDVELASTTRISASQRRVTSIEKL